MRFWKHWPYWLRGGVIGGGIGLALDIPPVLCYLFIGGFFCINISPMVFSGFLLNIFPTLSSSHPLQWLVVASILLSSIFGSFIGLIAGVFIKKRARDEASSMK